MIEHFSAEEALMEKTGYQKMEEHKKEHKFIKRKIAEFLIQRKKVAI